MKILKAMKKYATNILGGLATFVEYFLAIMLAVATVALCVYLIQAFTQIDGLSGWSDFYREVLETCLSLIVGVELVQMMYDHSPKMIFEVLLFCLARMVVINDDSMVSGLIGVVAIAVLFLTKKYLFDREDKFETAEEELSDIQQLREEKPEEFKRVNKYAKYVLNEKAEEAEEAGDTQKAEEIEDFEKFEESEEDGDSE